MRSRVRGSLVVVGVALVMALAGCGTPGTAPSPSATTNALSRLPEHASAYFFGDSWTQGYSASAGQGYAFVAGNALGWSVALAPDGSGTGYVHVNQPTAPTYPQRAAALPARITADVVVLQGSINDEAGPLGKLDGAVTKTVQLLREKTGDAPIIMLGPAPASSPVSNQLRQIDTKLAADAARLGIPYISPIKGDWINSANVRTVIDPTTFHPGTTGHAYFGGRVASAIQALVKAAK